MINAYYKFTENDATLYWAAGPETGIFLELSEIPPDRPVIPVADRAALAEILNHYGFPLGVLAGPDELVKQFEQAVTARLDSFAREKQYDNMDKARLASLTVDFKADGDFANDVYNKIWTAAFALEEEIRAGTLAVDDALDRVPEMAWPI